MPSLYYRDLLRQHWLIVGICTVLCGIGALLGSQFVPASYQSSVTVQINIPEINAAAFYDSDRLVQTRMQLATSQPVLLLVQQADQQVNVSRLSHQITTAQVLNSLLFQITIRDSDPTRAATIANDIADALITYQTGIDQQDDFHNVQPLQTQLDTQRTLIAQEKAQLSALVAPQDAAKIAKVRAQLDTDQQQYSQLLATLAQVQQAQTNKAVTMHIVQLAQPNDAPEKVNLVLNIGIGVLFGLLFGVCLVLLRDRFNQRVLSSQQVSELVDWPIITEVVPDQVGKRGAKHETNAYLRAVRGLAFLGLDEDIRSVAIVDATAQQESGKIAANLARAMAQAGKKTLLIDTDFQHSSQSHRFGLAQTPGLSDALLTLKTSQFDQQLATLVYPTSHDPLLAILPAGSAVPHPARLLQSTAMTEFVAMLHRSDFAFIIFSAVGAQDAPAMRILAAHTAGMVPIVDVQHIGREHLVRLGARLHQLGVTVLGCIIKGGQNHEPVIDSHGQR